MEKFKFGDIVSIDDKYIEYNIDTCMADVKPIRTTKELFEKLGFNFYSGWKCSYGLYRENDTYIQITLNAHGTIVCYKNSRLVFRTNSCKYLHDFQKLVEYINSTQNNILEKLEQNIKDLIK